MKTLVLTCLLSMSLLIGCSDTHSSTENTESDQSSQQATDNTSSNLGITPHDFLRSFNKEATKIGGEKLRNFEPSKNTTKFKYHLSSDFYVVGDTDKSGKITNIVTALIISDENRNNLVNKGETLVGITSIVSKVIDHGNIDKVRDDKLMDLYNELFEDDDTLKGENSKSMIYKNLIITIKYIPDLSVITFDIQPNT